jgi:fatty acid elongase 3
MSTLRYLQMALLLSEPLDISKWDFGQLDPLKADQFEWQYGVTPFSDLKFVASSIAAYFAIILVLKGVARSQKFDSKLLLALHNLILTVWSLLMFLGITYEVFQLALESGTDSIFCMKEGLPIKGRIYYWLYIYYVSKFYELIDTFFKAAKGSTIIFLHWYHHAIVIFMVWFWIHDGLIYASLGMIANTLIHVFMYYYYCVQSLGRSVWFKKYITSGQIVQFVSSFLLSIPFCYYHFFEKGCKGEMAFYFSCFCNGSFLLLFINFYQQTYKDKKKPE